MKFGQNPEGGSLSKEEIATNIKKLEDSGVSDEELTIGSAMNPGGYFIEKEIGEILKDESELREQRNRLKHQLLEISYTIASYGTFPNENSELILEDIQEDLRLKGFDVSKDEIIEIIKAKKGESKEFLAELKRMYYVVNEMGEQLRQKEDPSAKPIERVIERNDNLDVSILYDIATKTLKEPLNDRERFEMENIIGEILTDMSIFEDYRKEREYLLEYIAESKITGKASPADKEFISGYKDINSVQDAKYKVRDVEIKMTRIHSKKVQDFTDPNRYGGIFDIDKL